MRQFQIAIEHGTSIVDLAIKSAIFQSLTMFVSQRVWFFDVSPVRPTSNLTPSDSWLIFFCRSGAGAARNGLTGGWGAKKSGSGGSDDMTKLVAPKTFESVLDIANILITTSYNIHIPSSPIGSQLTHPAQGLEIPRERVAVTKFLGPGPASCRRGRRHIRRRRHATCRTGLEARLKRESVGPTSQQKYIEK